MHLTIGNRIRASFSVSRGKNIYIKEEKESAVVGFRLEKAIYRFGGENSYHYSENRAGNYIGGIMNIEIEPRKGNERRQNQRGNTYKALFSHEKDGCRLEGNKGMSRGKGKVA